MCFLTVYGGKLIILGMDNFGCLNSSLFLFYFCFVTSLRKKIIVYVRFQLNLLPPLPIRTNKLLAGTLRPRPSASTLWVTPMFS